MKTPRNYNAIPKTLIKLAPVAALALAACSGPEQQSMPPSSTTAESSTVVPTAPTTTSIATTPRRTIQCKPLRIKRWDPNSEIPISPEELSELLKVPVEAAMRGKSGLVECAEEVTLIETYKRSVYTTIGGAACVSVGFKDSVEQSKTTVVACAPFASEPSEPNIELSCTRESGHPWVRNGDLGAEYPVNNSQVAAIIGARREDISDGTHGSVVCTESLDLNALDKNEYITTIGAAGCLIIGALFDVNPNADGTVPDIGARQLTSTFGVICTS